MTLAGVVLAGGSSRRFGSDKLVADVEGRTMLSHVVENLSRVTSTVFLSVASEEQGDRLQGTLRSGIPIITDRRGMAGTGPVAGMVSSVLALRTEEVLFVAGDMPWVPALALERLVGWARQRDMEVATAHNHGVLEPLLQFQRRSAAAPLAMAALERPGSVRRSTDFVRASPRSGIVERRWLSEDAWRFSNVNTAADLSGVLGGTHDHDVTSSRGDPSSPVSLRPPSGAPVLYWTARRMEGEGRLPNAANLFEQESAVYRRLELGHLEYHCLADAARCVKDAGERTQGWEQRRALLRRKFTLKDGGACVANLSCA